MPTCPAGHASGATDYCDECGLPIRTLQSPAHPAPPPPAQKPTGQICPSCGRISPPDALFCEACGYDFITGTMPRGTVSQLLGFNEQHAVHHAEGADSHEPSSAATPARIDQFETVVEPGPHRGLAADSVVPSSDAPSPARADRDLASAQSTSDLRLESETPTSGSTPRRPDRRFVAEVWIDPDWYRVQSSPDPLPSPGLPEIFPLPEAGGLIGRASRTQRLWPDVDCGADSGCSRRQAQLSSDGQRWWIEDLGSANGTFVGDSGDPLPEEPIAAGRCELTADSRIYLGAWTRVVVRIATAGEEALFA